MLVLSANTVYIPVSILPDRTISWKECRLTAWIEEELEKSPTEWFKQGPIVRVGEYPNI